MIVDPRGTPESVRDGLVEHVQKVFRRAKAHGVTEGLWLFASQWQVVLDALRTTPSNAAEPVATCHKDGNPCYVSAGTDDAHWRCGTVQCGLKPPPASQDDASADVRGLVEEINWLLNEQTLSERQVALQGGRAVAPAAQRMAEANTKAFRLLPRILAALDPTGEAETFETVIAWGDETFGPCTQERAISRAGEEWDEMEEPGADVPVEAADVIICLLRIPGILDAINRKMKINRGRKWNLKGDGTGYHVKQEQP